MSMTIPADRDELANLLRSMYRNISDAGTAISVSIAIQNDQLDPRLFDTDDLARLTARAGDRAMGDLLEEWVKLEGMLAIPRGIFGDGAIEEPETVTETEGSDHD